MDVQIEALYILRGEQRFGKSDLGRVSGAQQFLHGIAMPSSDPNVEERWIRMLTEANPQERLSAALADDMVAVNDLIQERMASEHAPRIPEVSAHLINAGGKRLRPMLTCASARMCGYDGPYHVHLAATVEFIHTATLLHDDVVDESDKRRGRPTANILWNNQSSVLVGDYLFSRSFQLMVETGSMRVLDILANASATIAEGEVLQLSVANNLRTTEEIYFQVIRGKTAALFAAACEVGGVISDASAEVNRALWTYGDTLGIAFQLVDDLLDYGGASANLGKNTGDDFREGKMTLPVIRAIEAGTDAERDFWKSALVKGENGDDALAKAREIMNKYGTLEATKASALDYAAQAKASLSVLPASEIRSLLEDLTDYVVARVN